VENEPIELTLKLAPDDFDVERERYRKDEHYRHSVRRRAGVDLMKRRTALDECVTVLEQEWRLMCRGGQFSPARFRAAATVLLEEPKRESAGMSW
jgi:hypothetical protein